ncbi:MAG: hypothetical protein HYU57_04380 [Micavibrio aeruginosavorus]|nr:hypothetical protein [Micavibrio aeruginosavorus]
MCAVRKISFFLFLLGFVFLAAAPAFADCYVTEKSDYICDGLPDQSLGGTTLPPPPTDPQNPTSTPTTTNPVFLPADEKCSGGSDYEAFKQHLILREGYRTTVYRDSLGKPTVGVGHLVLPEDNLKVGDTITKEQVMAFLDKDAMSAWNAAQQQASEAGIASQCFVVALGSVNFQLGTGWRKKFPNTWKLIVDGKYKEAAEALNGTIWQQQTPVRVKDFQAALMELQRQKDAAATQQTQSAP